MSFDTSIEPILQIEGGYTDNPADSGGPTKYGITEHVARANGYQGPMQDLPESMAKSIYKLQYWDPLRLDDISALSSNVADELFDTAVNAGVGTAGKFLQRALNVLNKGQALYPDMTVDGVVGPLTVHALKSYMDKRHFDGETVLLKALNALQGAYYIELAEKRPKDEAFEFGWLKNRVWNR